MEYNHFRDEQIMFGRGKKKPEAEQAKVTAPSQDNATTIPQQTDPPRVIHPEKIHESGYVLQDEENIIAAEKVLSPKR